MAVIFGLDAFTVGANVSINAYPATPDYAYSRASDTTNMQVNATNDRVELIGATGNGGDTVARCIDAAVSATMGDQEARANCGTTNSAAGIGLALRYSSSTRGYVGIVDLNSANEIQIFEDNAGLSLLASKTGNFGTTLASTAFSFRATGPASQTDLYFTVGAISALIFSDTTAPATGAPGVYGYSGEVPNAGFIDDFEVDDLKTVVIAATSSPNDFPKFLLRPDIPQGRVI